MGRPHAKWQIELFFKWVKQNLKIKTFLGTSANAVMTQVWVALCLYLILAFIRFISKTVHSMREILNWIRINLFSNEILNDYLVPKMTEPKDGIMSELKLLATILYRIARTAKNKQRKHSPQTCGHHCYCPVRDYLSLR